jgi:hypothetical protein
MCTSTTQVPRYTVEIQMPYTVSQLSKKLLEFNPASGVEIVEIWVDYKGAVILSNNSFCPEAFNVLKVIKKLDTLPQEAPVKLNFSSEVYTDISNIFCSGKTVILV